MSRWEEQLCALYQKYLGVTLSCTQVTHSGIWELYHSRISGSVMSHQNCLGHILAHQSFDLKMLTQKYTDGYRRKMETLQNMCGARSKLCLADPSFLGRVCKSPWGNLDCAVLVGGKGDAIKA